MSDGRTALEMRIGGRVWWEGAFWTIATLAGGQATLESRDRTTVMTVNRLSELAIHSASELADADTDEVDDAAFESAALLAVLPRHERERIAREEAVLVALLGDESPTASSARVAAAAQELGVSERTMRRRIAAYRSAATAGLIDSRAVRRRASRVDSRWDDACRTVLASFTNSSTPTRALVIEQTALLLEREFGAGVVPLPHETTAYRRLNLLAQGRYTFGSAKGRRSVANRPVGEYGRLRADRVGQYVVLDTNDLDVYAMEPLTCRWIKVQLTVAMDLYSRCILGLRLTPTTKSIDVANVLYQAIRPEMDPPYSSHFPYHGVPEAVLLGSEVPDARLAGRRRGMPAVFPESIVVDHGKQYLSKHLISSCSRLGISVQPARPKTPTDKPNIERFFRTLRTSLLERLPAYKGPDVYNRGEDVESDAFLWIGELEQIIREWVGSIYHRSTHKGLTLPDAPRLRLSPLDAYEIGLARAGGLSLPPHEALVFDFLDVKWRTIQHYGVDIDGLRYNGEVLNAYRGLPSTTGKAQKWPFHVDPHDVRFVYFKDPADRSWHKLAWEHMPSLDAPFSRDAAAYSKRLALAQNHHVDPRQAVQGLLDDWVRGAVVERRARNLAVRLSTQRQELLSVDAADDAADKVPDISSLPMVVDFLKRKNARDLPPDELDVFEQFPPGEFGFEVMDD